MEEKVDEPLEFHYMYIIRNTVVPTYLPTHYLLIPILAGEHIRYRTYIVLHFIITIFSLLRSTVTALLSDGYGGDALPAVSTL